MSTRPRRPTFSQKKLRQPMCSAIEPARIGPTYEVSMYGLLEMGGSSYDH